MEKNYQVLDIEDNIDGSATILVRVLTEHDPVYFLLMNLRDDATGEDVVYDLLIGHEAESGGIEWLKETDSPDKYNDLLDDVIEDVLNGE